MAVLDDKLENHKRTTVTMWGTRRSSTNINGDGNGIIIQLTAASAAT